MSSLEKILETFKEELGQIVDMEGALALLQWDQEVYMPPKAAAARGQQLATLSALAHRQFTSDKMGGLLHELKSAEPELDADTVALVNETLYDYDQATKLPEHFVHRFAVEQSKAYEVWTQARKDSAFKQFAPQLGVLMALLHEKADYLGYETVPYDALIGEYERGMTSAKLQTLFGELAPQQRALVARIREKAPSTTPAWLAQEWDEEKQWQFSLQVLKDMGYDFDAGRQDRSVHPFTTNFDLYDVRVTTRLDRKELFSGLTGSIHEGGHALYEQGFLPKDQRTTLAQGISLGIHESQSRMWENMIGRSLPFWKHYTPQLKRMYPGQLDNVHAEDIYRAINHVEPSFIRVEADECTYNLHIILRFEIEQALMAKELKVEEIPEAWNAKMQDYLGLEVPNDRLGCLQDIHWSHGSIGYFPTYALGNLYAAQLFEKIEADLPNLWTDIEDGQFQPLLQWLRRNVHQVGRRQQAEALLESVTGKAPESQPFLQYLEGKYSRIYGL